MPREQEENAPQPTVIVADPPGAAVLGEAMARRGVPVSHVIPPGRGWRRIGEQFGKAPFFLVVALARGFGASSIRLVSAIRRANGEVLVWSTGSANGSRAWMLERLLMQAGATLFDTPDEIASYLQLSRHRTQLIENGIAIQGPPSSVKERLGAALARAQLLNRAGPDPVQVNVGSAGIFFENGNGSALGDPRLVSDTLARLRSAADAAVASEDGLPATAQDISLLVGPPRRLLSEVASKKLLAAFGLKMPRERLCRSQSEAVRWAARHGGPVVLKLVKPNLENKAQTGAVVLNQTGSAAVRRAAQTLEGLGASLGPPPPLGVLVSEQITPAVSIWLAMRDHPGFGRLLLGGVGDRPGSDPGFVLRTPADTAASMKALRHAEISGSDRALARLAVAVARISSVLSELGDRIERAEIHPLVLPSDESTAMVLDALFVIAD